MEIVTDGPYIDDWVVLAPWFGAKRVVFRGTVFQCIAFKREHSD